MLQRTIFCTKSNKCSIVYNGKFVTLHQKNKGQTIDKI